MSARRPTLDERDAFLLKLIGFRQTLAPHEQRMLDALAVAAFCEDPAAAPITRERIRPHAETSPWLRSLDRLDDR